jgi:predicted lipoprotein with Yx(FWY)xxD motif
MLHRLIVPLVAVALGLMLALPASLMLALPAMAQPAEPLVKVATDPTLGKILVDSKGMTLYLYSRDELGVSNCFDQCEVRWPILKAPDDGAPTGSSDIGGELTTITRKDGSKIVAYNNIPLYYWYQDVNPGDTKGQAVGGVWWILPPGLKQITPAVPQASPVASPAAQTAAPAPAAKPAGAAPAAASAPAQTPAALPRTGGLPVDPTPLTMGFGAAGVAMTALGAALLRRRNRKG